MPPHPLLQHLGRASFEARAKVRERLRMTGQENHPLA